MIEPIARIMPVRDWWTRQSYRLTFLVCRCCGQRVGLIGGVWLHLISGDEECAVIPFWRERESRQQGASRRPDSAAERSQPEIKELRRDLGYPRRHLNHLFTLTETRERPDLRGAMLDDLREIRGLLSVVGAHISNLEG
jgi:hypothetical protein